MSTPIIPDPAIEPDDREGDEFFSPAREELPTTAAGVLNDAGRRGSSSRARVAVIVFARRSRSMRSRQQTARCSTSRWGARTPPSFDEKEMPRAGDGVAVTIFPPDEGGGYPYALRVSRNGQLEVGAEPRSDEEAS